MSRFKVGLILQVPNVFAFNFFFKFHIFEFRLKVQQKVKTETYPETNKLEQRGGLRGKRSFSQCRLVLLDWAVALSSASKQLFTFFIF